MQRVAIARAISVEPRFLVADEPVSMLDVSIRAGILNLLRYFATELRMAILYISHDLSTMRHVCTTIAVMYLGRIIESGPADTVLDTPLHPYTQALVGAVPVMGGRRTRPQQSCSAPCRMRSACRAAAGFIRAARRQWMCAARRNRCCNAWPAARTLPVTCMVRYQWPDNRDGWGKR